MEDTRVVLSQSKPVVPIVKADGMKKAGKQVRIMSTGEQVWLGAQLEVIVDTYCETKSFRECIRKVKDKGIRTDARKVWWYLNDPLVRKHIGERLEAEGYANGWTKDYWMMRMSQGLEDGGKVKDFGYLMKTIADVKGWDVREAPSFNQQIVITQANGKE